MTDIEFWLVLAEMIEGARSLPERFIDIPWTICTGLCGCINAAEETGLIDASQNSRLKEQLYSLPNANRRMYFWNPFEWQPRARACRRIAAKLMKEAA